MVAVPDLGARGDDSGELLQHGPIPHVLEYVQSGRLKLDGIVNKTYRVEEWDECLEAVRKQTVVKAAIVFD